MSRPLRIILVLGVLGTAAAAWFVRPSAPAPALPSFVGPPLPDWKTRVVQATVMTESRGRFDAINANTDGAGLSFGILQWAQKPGGLGTLLAAMNARDPARFRSYMGASSADLLRVTKAGGVTPVDGAYLWQEPWRSRFVQLAADPVFQQVQLEQAAAGPYMAAAVQAAKSIGGTPTERGLAILFDTATQQGPGALRGLVAASRGATFHDRLLHLVQLAVQRVAGKRAGSVDLGTAVQNRLNRLLASSALSDRAVVL